LVKNNYKILERNYRTKWGEIDIVASKNKKITFFEVKTRVGDQKGKPFEAVNFYKIQGLRRAIRDYLLKKKANQCKLSVDVIGIVIDDCNGISEIKHYSNLDIGLG